MATIATDKDEEEKTSYMEDLKVDAHTLQGKEGREKSLSRRANPRTVFASLRLANFSQISHHLHSGLPPSFALDEK